MSEEQAALVHYRLGEAKETLGRASWRENPDGAEP